MLGELGDGELASESIPQELAHDLIHLMAHQKMIAETQHILSRVHTDDAMVVVGSEMKLRLEILAIDEELENALFTHDSDDPSKHFIRLLERLDNLRKSLTNAGKSVVTEKWPEMRAAIVRQAALSCILAQQRNHTGPEPFDWSAVSTKEYIRVVNRLIPEVDVDLDALGDEEQMSASKQRRNLIDIYWEKRPGVSSLKLRTLLKENKLSTFEKDMKAFTRALDQAVLPKPKLLELYGSGSRLLYDTVNEVHPTDGGHGDSHSPGKSSIPSSARRAVKRKVAPSILAADESPQSALAKANKCLQHELQGRPGSVAEALAISESMSSPSSPAAKRVANDTNGGGSADKRSAPPAARRSEKSVTRRKSVGEQVDFDDSQSVDEPLDPRYTLGNRLSPGQVATLAHSARKATAKRDGPRARNPWTEEEVKHLKAAVSALGKGKWALALAQYKFNSCRTAVDLKDKWRNLSK